MMWGMWLIPLIIVLVIYLIVKDYFPKSGESETPLEILNKRYARGEITKETFEQMKKDLQ
jgi:putative membrane protein